MAYSRTRKAPEGARAMFAVLFVSAAVVVAPAGDGNTDGAAVSKPSRGQERWTGMLGVSVTRQSLIMVYHEPNVLSTPRCFVPGGGFLKAVPSGERVEDGGMEQMDDEGSLWQQVLLPTTEAQAAPTLDSSFGWALRRHVDGTVYLRPALARRQPYIAMAGECFDPAAYIQVDESTGDHMVVRSAEAAQMLESTLNAYAVGGSDAAAMGAGMGGGAGQLYVDAYGQQYYTSGGQEGWPQQAWQGQWAEHGGSSAPGAWPVLPTEQYPPADEAARDVAAECIQADQILSTVAGIFLACRLLEFAMLCCCPGLAIAYHHPRGSKPQYVYTRRRSSGGETQPPRNGLRSINSAKQTATMESTHRIYK